MPDIRSLLFSARISPTDLPLFMKKVSCCHHLPSVWISSRTRGVAVSCFPSLSTRCDCGECDYLVRNDGEFRRIESYSRLQSRHRRADQIVRHCTRRRAHPKICETTQ